MLKKFLIAAAAAMTCAGSALALPVLNVGTQPVFQPFEFVDGRTKQLVGYDIDLIRAAAKHMGYEIKFAPMGLDGLIPAVMTGNIDLITSGLTITPERQKKIDFTRPVYHSSQVLLVNKSDAHAIRSEKDLRNKTVCVEIASAGAELARTIPGAKLKTFNSLADDILEMQNRGCAAVISDKPAIEYYLKQRGTRSMVEVQTGFPKEEIAFAVRKGNKKLLDQLNRTLLQMEKSGETAKIYKKWFGN